MTIHAIHRQGWGHRPREASPRRRRPGRVSRSRSLLDREILAHAIPVGTEPVGVAVALVADTVFVTNVIGETVRVINGQTNTVTVNINPPAGNSPARVAFSPLTGTVYVAGNGNVSAIPFTTCTIRSPVPTSGS